MADVQSAKACGFTITRAASRFATGGSSPARHPQLEHQCETGARIREVDSALLASAAQSVAHGVGVQQEELGRRGDLSWVEECTHRVDQAGVLVLAVVLDEAGQRAGVRVLVEKPLEPVDENVREDVLQRGDQDRKSTRLNSSH